MEELLSLKWNNHRSTFLHILGVLRDKQSYTDVTLACDGKFYSVHKLVLSTCSDYFCAMFEKTSCKSPVIVLKDIKSEDLEALLDYMYLGEVNVRQSDLASLIKAAENLRIKGLAVPDDEPPKKSGGGGVGASSRRDGGVGSPPTKRKRRDESEDGREDVRPLGGGDLHTPPPPSSSRPKSPIRLSPSPHRTSQESHAGEDRDNRPSLSSPADSSHSQAQMSSHQSLQSTAQQLGDQMNQSVSNQYSGGGETPYVKVEMPDDDTDGANRDSYISSDSFKEEAGDMGELSNDLPEFLQQAASGALAGTSATYHQSFAGPSGFQSEVSGWHGDGQSLPGNFTGIGFPPSQDNPPGIGAEHLGNVCKVCGKVFNGRNWKQNLEYHFLTHTKEKPFKCPICPHCSALKYNLIRHIRNRHWEVLAPTFLNLPGEREGMEGRNPLPSNRDTNIDLPLNESGQQQPSTSDIRVDTPLSTSIVNQSQCQENLMNMNPSYQLPLSVNQEIPISTSNSHSVQMTSASDQGIANQALSMSTNNDHIAQMSATLNPLNVGHEIPLSGGQDLQNLRMSQNCEVQLAATSQGGSVIPKADNQET